MHSGLERGGTQNRVDWMGPLKSGRRSRRLIILSVIGLAAAGPDCRGCDLAARQNHPGRRPADGPGHGGRSDPARRPDLLRRARHRGGLQHGRHPHPGQRPAAVRQLPPGPGGPPGRRAGDDRSGAAAGRARSGRRQEGGGPGATDRAQKDLDAVHDAWRARTSRPSRTSTSSKPRSISSRPSIDADQGAIESAQTQLSYATITAPIDGRRRLPPGRCRQHHPHHRSAIR